MIDMDLEDYLEEVKFQMTQWDYLSEDDILEWEEHAREWVDVHTDDCMKKNGEEVTIFIKEEDVCEEVARLYYRAIRDQDLERYWRRFHIIAK